MIKHFQSKETEKLFNRQFVKKLPQVLHKIALRKLWMIDAAMNINDLRITPSNHLELLQGKRKGQYSIKINDQWRICFTWKEGNAYHVEIIDYH